MTNYAWKSTLRKSALLLSFALMAALPIASRADEPPPGGGVGCTGGPGEDVATSLLAKNPIQGTTPLEIQQRFASIIEGNFANGPAESVIRHLSDRELFDLASRYNESTSAGNRPLMATFAKRLGDKSLVRVANAFGKQQVLDAVNQYASPEVRAAALPKLNAIAPDSLRIQPMTAPTTDMSIEDIYLEFRTAQVGSLSPASALSETASFAGRNILLAYWVGNQIGTQINNAINTYDPSLGDAIGGTVYGMVNAIQSAANDVSQGSMLKSVDDLFGSPVWDSHQYWGDYDDMMPMYDFYLSGGSSCD
ncbi:hypothetical protein [Dyella caseinilytica]|uniref:DUF2059 domain-containing protein n=1 Tax=Dyella caseinilytica TaxID=1849581 RepID=A0ABX7GQ30_9GAMM|nr:hypothetical protein [Dyella caseinilytica]QRN52409.1 hypothetical protein ISN74_13075 [Dyella caseinilytica]GGA05730.1 hypothetical protein GCM10011408_28330 [Dyella caseinilytica]